MSYNSRISDYSRAVGEASAQSQRVSQKLQDFKAKSQAVQSFNSANEMGNYLKDGINTAKGIGIDVGLGSIKKLATGGLDRLQGIRDSLNKTEGGLEGLDKRMTSRFTSIKRAQIRNRQNLKMNQKSRAMREDPDADANAPDETINMENAVDEGGDVIEDGDDIIGGITEGVEGVGGALAEEGAELGGEALLEGGLDLLDATGVGAIVGIPLQIATGVGMAISTYDLGKNLWHDFTDIFSHGGQRGDKDAPTPTPALQTSIAPTMES